MEEFFKKELDEQIDKLPYTKHLDDGQYNDGVITGFELGAEWAYKYFEKALKAYEVKRVLDQEFGFNPNG